VFGDPLFGQGQNQTPALVYQRSYRLYYHRLSYRALYIYRFRAVVLMVKLKDLKSE
jgi:hypothetical protein